MSDLDYRLPDGRIVPLPVELCDGAATYTLTLADGATVQAWRQPPALAADEPAALYGARVFAYLVRTDAYGLCTDHALELADHAGVSIAAAREMADAARATVSAVRHRIARTLAARAQEARETAEARARVAAPPPDDDEPGTWPAPLMPRPRVNPPAGAVARLEF